MDRLDLDDERFAAVLATELYSDLTGKLNPRSSANLVMEALDARHIGSLPKAKWQEFIDEMTFSFPVLRRSP